MDGTIPPEVLEKAGGENADFALKSARERPLRTTAPIIVFGLIFMGFSSLFFSAMFLPVMMGQEVSFEENGVPTTAGPGNLAPLIMPGIIVGIFMLVGAAIAGYGVKSVLADGGWFIGTPTRLLIVQKNTTRSIDWEQFTGTIEVRGGQGKADIDLELRTGQMVSQKNSGPRYVPDHVYICGATNPTQLEEKLRKRITENDPTPPHT